MAQQSRDGNVFFSPISVVASILTLSLGAEGNDSQRILEALKLNKTGLSETEIHKCFQYFLRATNQPAEMSPLISGSSMFIQQGLKLVDKSMKGIKDLYASEVISTNFRESSKAKAQINNHMMKKTKKEIGTMVKELKNDTFLALMNYIIWNGKGDVTEPSWLQGTNPNRCLYFDVLRPWHPKFEKGNMPTCVFF